MHSSVSALQTSAWEPSPVLGEAAAGDGAAAVADELAGAGDGAAAYAEPLSERRHGYLRTYHKKHKKPVRSIALHRLFHILKETCGKLSPEGRGLCPGR